FHNEFLGAATTPSQRLSASAPSHGRWAATSRTATVSAARMATATSMSGSTGSPGQGGLVQVDAIPSRLSQPLIDSLVQYVSGPRKYPARPATLPAPSCGSSRTPSTVRPIASRRQRGGRSGMAASRPGTGYSLMAPGSPTMGPGATQ